jgi:hypothetical protein
MNITIREIKKIPQSLLENCYIDADEKKLQAYRYCFDIVPLFLDALAPSRY